MIVSEPKHSTSRLGYQKKNPIRKRDPEVTEETVNEQVARPLVGGSLLSLEVIAFLANERIKTQEYQPVTDITVLDPRRRT